MMHRISLFVGFAVLSCMLTSSSMAQWTKVRRELGHHHQIGTIRVFYDTKGEHAVPTTDANHDGVPDQVEDIAKQTWVAQQILVKTLGFPSPLESDRYKEAEFIDVNILSHKYLKRNSVAYDGLQKFGRKIDDPDTRAMSFDVSTKVDARTTHVPAQTYFFLVQYGAHRFKSTWCTMGAVEWSDHAVSKNGLGDIRYASKSVWPQKPKKVKQIFAMKNEAEEHIWNPLANLDDKNGTIPIADVDDRVKRLRYSNEEKVLIDFKLSGAALIRDILIELGKQDDIAAKELEYGKGAWAETNQRSRNNDPYIYQGIMNAVRARGHKVGPFSAKEFIENEFSGK